MEQPEIIVSESKIHTIINANRYTFSNKFFRMHTLWLVKIHVGPTTVELNSIK